MILKSGASVLPELGICCIDECVGLSCIALDSSLCSVNTPGSNCIINAFLASSTKLWNNKMSPFLRHSQSAELTGENATAEQQTTKAIEPAKKKRKATKATRVEGRERISTTPIIAMHTTLRLIK